MPEQGPLGEPPPLLVLRSPQGTKRRPFLAEKSLLLRRCQASATSNPQEGGSPAGLQQEASCLSSWRGSKSLPRLLHGRTAPSSGHQDQGELMAGGVWAGTPRFKTLSAEEAHRGTPVSPSLPPSLPLKAVPFYPSDRKRSREKAPHHTHKVPQRQGCLLQAWLTCCF